VTTGKYDRNPCPVCGERGLTWKLNADWTGRSDIRCESCDCYWPTGKELKAAMIQDRDPTTGRKPAPVSCPRCGQRQIYAIPNAFPLAIRNVQFNLECRSEGCTGRWLGIKDLMFEVRNGSVSAARTVQQEKNAMQIELRLDQIRPGRWQPRQQFDRARLISLAQSIKTQGLINPIIVFADEDGTYELLAGERRWRASMALAMENRGELNMSLETAATIVCEQDPGELVKKYVFLAGYTIRAEKRSADSPELLHQIAILDNLQRHDLSPVEEAQALHDLQQEHGYSIRKLAEVTGLSKSYVEDRLKLLNLAPEVAQLITPNGSGPALDLTLARDLARKVPAEMQAPIVGYLQQRQANAPIGEETTKKGQAVISRITAWLDPERWALPEDRVWSPEVRNRSRLMQRLIQALPREQLAAALVKLDQPQNSWDSSGYLGKKPLDLLERKHEFWRMVSVLRDVSQADWDGTPEVTAAGWTCGNCQLQHLVTLFGERAPSFDRAAPCKRMTVGEGIEVHTCEEFLGADDPPFIRIPQEIRLFLDDTNGQKELTRIGDSYASTYYYVEEPLTFHALYTAARQAKEKEDDRKERANREAHLGPMRLYWEAQQDGTPFDLDHFQAHSCRKCYYYRPEDGHPELDRGGAPDELGCKFAREPLRHDYGDRPARAPEYGILQSGPVAVPRCEKFSYAFLPDIKPPKKAGYNLPDRELVISWYKKITRHSHYYSSQAKTWGVLRWLAGGSGPDDLKKLWRNLTDDAMMTIFQTGLREHETLTEYGSSVILLDPTTLEETSWFPIGFGKVTALPGMVKVVKEFIK
jgi:ParB family chromosome partitioning protein